MATGVSAQGDTSYSLGSALVLDGGPSADGRSLWIANVDTTPNDVIVTTSGSAEGERVFVLSGKGDEMIIPLGDIRLVTIEASAYPTLIGYAYVSPGMRIRSGAAVAPALAQTDISAGAQGAATPLVATLVIPAGKTGYLSGFEITGDGATAGTIIVATVTGLTGGTLSYVVDVPAGTANAINPIIVEFTRPIPASGPGVSIAVNLPSFGAGNVAAAVTAHGYYQ